MIKVVLFDVMGVIFRVGDDTNDLLVPFVQNLVPTRTKESIVSLYLEASLGKLTAERFWHELGLGDRSNEIEGEYLDSYLEFDGAVVETARALKERYRLGLLSNDVSEWSAYLRHKHGLNDLFGTSIISGDVGLRKPAPEIFTLAASTMNARPNECIFLDDQLRNLKAAHDAGMKTIHFHRYPSSLEFSPDREIFHFRELEAAVAELAREA